MRGSRSMELWCRHCLFVLIVAVKQSTTCFPKTKFGALIAMQHLYLISYITRMSAPPPHIGSAHLHFAHASPGTTDALPLGSLPTTSCKLPLFHTTVNSYNSRPNLAAKLSPLAVGNAQGGINRFLATSLAQSIHSHVQQHESQR
jgi:hypothetical protein